MIHSLLNETENCDYKSWIKRKEAKIKSDTVTPMKQLSLRTSLGSLVLTRVTIFQVLSNVLTWFFLNLFHSIFRKKFNIEFQITELLSLCSDCSKFCVQWEKEIMLAHDNLTLNIFKNLMGNNFVKFLADVAGKLILHNIIVSKIFHSRLYSILPMLRDVW